MMAGANRCTFNDVSENPGIIAAAERFLDIRGGLPLDAFNRICVPVDCPRCGRSSNLVSHQTTRTETPDGLIYNIAAHYRCTCNIHRFGSFDFDISFEYTPPTKGGTIKRV